MLNHLTIPLATGFLAYIVLYFVMKKIAKSDDGKKKRLWKCFGVIFFSSLGMFVVRVLLLAGGPTFGSFAMLYLASGVGISLGLLLFYRVKPWQDRWTAGFIAVLTLFHAFPTHIVFLKITMAAITG